MKYVPSAFVGQLSRSAGSTTASRNRFGSYFRNRVMPVNPSTPAQAEIRTTMGDISAGWRGLTEVQRDAWTSLGAQITRTDSLGQSYTLTGLQAYTSLNMVLDVTGGTELVAAPAMPSNPAEILTTTVTLDDVPTMSVAYTPTPIGASTKFILEATRPVSQGISFMPRSEYKIIHVSAANAASPVNALAEYQAIYGTPPLDSKVFYRAWTVDANGFKSVPVYFSEIVVSGA